MDLNLSGSAQMALGAVLVLGGGVVVLAMLSGVGPNIPAVVGGFCMLLMAVGSLLIGVSGEDGRPV